MPQAGQHVVIIGGSKNLGFELAKATAALGAKVTLTSRSEDTAKEAAAAIGGQATGAG